MCNFVCGVLLVFMAFVSGAGTAEAGTPDLGRAIRDGATAEDISRLIREGADVNRKDPAGITPLMKAAILGRVVAASTLLKAGAKADAVTKIDDMPATAWDFAVIFRVISGNDEILQVVPAVGPDGRELTDVQAAARVQPAVAAFARRVVKGRLARVRASMDRLTTGLLTFYGKEGGFPGRAGAVEAVDAERPTSADTVWARIGFAKYPPLPIEVAAVHYIPFSVGKDGLARSFGLVYQLRGIKPRTVDGQLVAISPSKDMVVTGPASALLSAVQMDAAAPKRVLYYSCHRTSEQPVDPLVTGFFANAGVSLSCP